MSWSYKRVMMSVIVLWATVQGCRSSESDDKTDEGDKKSDAVGIPVSYDRNGNLYIAQGKELKKVGSSEVAYRHGASISAFACSTTDQNIVGMLSNGMLWKANLSTKKATIEYENSMMISVHYAKDGTLLTTRSSDTADGFSVMNPPKVGLNNYILTRRAFWKRGSMWSKKFFSVMRGNKRWGLMAAPDTSNVVSLGGLVLCKEAGEPRDHIKIWQDERFGLKDFSYADRRLAMLCKKERGESFHIILHSVDLKNVPPPAEYSSNQTTHADRTPFIKSDSPERSLEVDDNYDRIELTGGNGLVATKPDSGADFYSISGGYGVFNDRLKKKSSISTNGRIKDITSTPPGWLSCGRTALSTDNEVQEIDSGTGEHIGTYNSEGRQISQNWWRTVRRNVVMPVLGATSVAAAVLAYSHFQGKK